MWISRCTRERLLRHGREGSRQTEEGQIDAGREKKLYSYTNRRIENSRNMCGNTQKEQIFCSYFTWAILFFFFFLSFFWCGPFFKKSLLNLLQYCFYFMVWFFDPETWDLSFLIRDQTHTPYTGRWRLNPGPPGKSQRPLLMRSKEIPCHDGGFGEWGGSWIWPIGTDCIPCFPSSHLPSSPLYLVPHPSNAGIDHRFHSRHESWLACFHFY